MRPARDPTPGSAADGQPDADPEQVARSIALRRVASAPRTCFQLREDLVARGVTPELADRIVSRFLEVGLLNDSEFARMWVESRHRTRGSARTVLRRELRERGVADEIVAGALEHLDADSERQRALELARARLRRSTSVAADRKERRLIAYLVRRGYSSTVAYEAVRIAVTSPDAADEPGWGGSAR